MTAKKDPAIVRAYADFYAGCHSLTLTAKHFDLSVPAIHRNLKALGICTAKAKMDPEIVAANRSAYDRQWAKTHPESRSATARRCRQRTPEEERAKRERKSHLRRHHGLTLGDYAAMEESQNGRCAICGMPPNLQAKHKKDRHLHVDHDHQTGQNRGLLCGPCNMGLGQFKEDQQRLAAAQAYLFKHKDWLGVVAGLQPATPTNLSAAEEV